ncbi:MAG TPA: hypothetical protein VF015_09680, partial [Acidimicrobiales bacterium]
PRRGPARRTRIAGAGLALALVAGACSGDDGGSGGEAAADEAPPDTLLPLAPESDRVDLDTPTFTHPTEITNPLFPIADLHSAILLGNEDHHPLKIETTLIAEPRVIEIDGEPVDVLESQFAAYLDGRIEEVALDWYAQADDGSVWYLGEDVFNYEDGAVADTDGTWLAGEDGPPALIMPADPQVGDVFRPENMPDLLEEVTVRAVDVTVDGPRGPVTGAIVAEENHTLEGTYEDKTFAPGYGEFASGLSGDLEALALAVPTDAAPGPVPGELTAISDGAADVRAAAEAGDWGAATEGLDAMRSAWAAYRTVGGVPPLLDEQMTQALDALAGDGLAPAVEARNAGGARKAAIDVAHAGLDLQLRYRPPAEIDAGRFALWAEQIRADAAKPDEPGWVAGDVTVLEWIWQRIDHTFDDAVAGDVEAHLDSLRAAADDEDVAAASRGADQLLATLGAGR